MNPRPDNSTGGALWKIRTKNEPDKNMRTHEQPPETTNSKKKASMYDKELALDSLYNILFLPVRQIISLAG